ncbi:GNAT family N-acetyltransferase [bacterium]|nr:GNAT family N-acetyltransferase [bacterium]
MSYKLLGLKDKVEWNSYLELLPVDQQDVYYAPEYYQLYEEKGDGKAKCFLFKKGDNFLLYPFLINSINDIGYTLNEEYYDIQGCYGLNGPISNTKDKAFIKEFREIFAEHCRTNNVIAEFTRFNPLLGNESLFNPNEVIYVGETVNVKLDLDFNEVWRKSFSRDIRRIVNKGKDSGYQANLKLLSEASEDEIDEFSKIYFSTLNRNNAERFYYFDKDYIIKMKNLMGDSVLFCSVIYQEQVIAASINPFKGINSYGFLGGSYREFQKISPFTFMMNAVISKLQCLGIENYFLGGGEDSILNYKKNFNKNDLRKYYIGKAIHHKLIYNQVIKQWEDEGFSSTGNNKLLRYRDKKE